MDSITLMDIYKYIKVEKCPVLQVATLAQGRQEKQTQTKRKPTLRDKMEAMQCKMEPKLYLYSPMCKHPRSGEYKEKGKMNISVRGPSSASFIYKIYTIYDQSSNLFLTSVWGINVWLEPSFEHWQQRLDQGMEAMLTFKTTKSFEEINDACLFKKMEISCIYQGVLR